MRKFYYYLKFWDQWGFRMNEFNYYDWTTYYSLQSTKAENYIKDCLRAGKPQPYPYYEKSKDDYWDYVKPNSFEIILDEQLKRGARDRAIYYHQQSEFTEAAPFENSIDLIKALAGDDWRSEETLNRILATFPDLIMTINAKTGEPVTTAMMDEGLDVYVITTDKKNLKLSPTMYAPELLKATEDVIKKDLISYLDK